MTRPESDTGGFSRANGGNRTMDGGFYLNRLRTIIVVPAQLKRT